jgi:undecaprenyl pyrophosphate phosphatase UppP
MAGIIIIGGSMSAQSLTGRRCFASIAWLLRFVAKHSITVFIWYRVALAAVIALLLGTRTLSPT